MALRSASHPVPQPLVLLALHPPVAQVMGMPGMVTSIVESLKYLTPMAFDVMTFAVLKQLASPKKKLKVRAQPGAVAQAGWLGSDLSTLPARAGRAGLLTSCLAPAAHAHTADLASPLLALPRMMA